MKFKIGLGAGVAVMLGAGISAALAQVTLISTDGTLTCSSHNGVQVSSSGAVTINVGSCDLGSGTGGDNGPGGPVAPVLVQSTNALPLQQGGPAGNFTVALTGAPAQSVTLPLTSSNNSIATVTPSSLEFTPSNWNSQQTVTVTGTGPGLAYITGTAGSLSVNLTATVTAASGGGSTGGSDPGLGIKWQTTYQGRNVFVVDRSAYSGRTYYPGCLSRNWPALGLNHNSSLSPFDGLLTNRCGTIGSLRAGDVYSQRLPFARGSQGFSIQLERAEHGETGGQAYDIAISRIPGDLNPTGFPNDRCVAKGVTQGSLSLMGRSVWEQQSSRTRSAYCPLEENTLYYFNFAPSPGTQGATSCGVGSYICRMQVIQTLQPEYFQDVRVQSENY